MDSQPSFGGASNAVNDVFYVDHVDLSSDHLIFFALSP